METVNVQCGHCGKLMAVGANLLGQQVRCSHCQQVVLAPATVPAAPPPAQPEAQEETRFNLPGAAERESIFGPQDEADDLFGGPVQPRVEMPPDPAAPLPPTELLSLSAPAAPAPVPQVEPALSYMPPEPTAALLPILDGGGAGEANVTATAGNTGFASAGVESVSGLSLDPLAEAIPRPVVRPPAPSSWGLPMLVIPLISYSILATIAVIILYLRQQNQPTPPHPLEFVPDVEGAKPGAQRQKSSRMHYRLPPFDYPLPDRLRVALGESITVGDLEITPQKIELRQLRYHVPGTPGTEPSLEEALVMALHLRNISSVVRFYPMDPYFDRLWKKNRPSRPPFTFLELVDANKRFYGGPVEWEPPRKPHVVEGQNYEVELKPGEEVDTFVCTDPDDHVKQALENYHGPLLWRVQVRRGLVQVGERELSATAVIGVDFTDADIHRDG